MKIHKLNNDLSSMGQKKKKEIETMDKSMLDAHRKAHNCKFK